MQENKKGFLKIFVVFEAVNEEQNGHQTNQITACKIKAFAKCDQFCHS